ncbi:MAG TPA: hypothetical protein VF691_13940 [Cytophagaceae bacterium]|jgi:hypothetical protein
MRNIVRIGAAFIAGVILTWIYLTFREINRSIIYSVNPGVIINIVNGTGKDIDTLVLFSSAKKEISKYINIKPGDKIKTRLGIYGEGSYELCAHFDKKKVCNGGYVEGYYNITNLVIENSIIVKY